MSMKYHDYCLGWKELSEEIKSANQYICQECGRQCRTPGEKFDNQRWTLTVAHYFHDYEEEEVFLACLCAPCHLRHDAPHSRFFKLRARIFRQRQAGQLDFLPSFF
jgi:hypothetical protein